MKLLLLYIVVVLLGSVFVSGKNHKHTVPTYFRRLSPDGNLIDRLDWEGFNKIFNTPAILEEAASPETCKVAVTPSLAGNHETVTISWHGVENPNRRDWIGMFCPAGDPAKYVLDYFEPALVSIFTWQQGYGTNDVIVYNMRTDCEFRYYLVNDTATALACRSNLLQFEGGNTQPLQGHLSLTGKASEMRVMWISGRVENPVVKYGLKKSSLSEVAPAKVTTYRASDMCEAPANTRPAFIDPGYIHDALMTDLKAGKRYFYSYGSSKKMSPVYNFTTPLPAGDTTPYNFIMYGDMGISAYPRAVGTADRMLEEYRDNDIKLIFHNGDISYARGIGYIWEQWHALIEPYATLMPYMIGIGNHEQDHLKGGSKDPSGAPGEGFHPKWGNLGDDSNGECGVPMFKRFHMPDNGNFVWWHSYDFGLVHFIMMSTEHDYQPGSRQYKWLENDLKSVDRKKTPWVILGGHRAMYASQDELGDFKTSQGMQRMFEDLIYKYKVDLGVWAHYHSYERTCKVYKRECVKEATTHLVVGTAGKSIDSQKWLGKQWSVARGLDFGYVRVSVVNSTATHLEYVKNIDKSVADDFWLIK